jgi:chloramphenicol-sensitive protein RarD
MKKGGTLAAIGAYAIWGLLPVYWKAIQEVPAFEILCHRIVWSFVFVALLLLWKRRWEWLEQARRPITLLVFLATGCILSLNWFLYIWAVNAGRILDPSLGYFINPLLSVLLGVLFLRERLRVWQWVSVGIAAVAVIYLTVSYGAFPWVAITLAVTFGTYGLLRKTAALDALEGLGLETTFMLFPALGYLVYLERVGAGSFGHATAQTNVLLALAGVVTASPLILFGYAAKRVTLATVGILQYIAPTGQFLLGVLVYGEDFGQARMIGFSAIWVALLIYSIEGFVEGRRNAQASPPS